VNNEHHVFKADTSYLNGFARRPMTTFIGVPPAPGVLMFNIDVARLAVCQCSACLIFSSLQSIDWLETPTPPIVSIQSRS